MINLEFYHPSTVQEMSKTILAIEENEDTIVIKEKKKTRIFDMHSWVKMAQNL